jgi:hypothetical protein
MKVFDPTLYRNDRNTDVKRVTEASSRPAFVRTFPGSGTDSVVSLRTSIAPNLIIR